MAIFNNYVKLPEGKYSKIYKPSFPLGQILAACLGTPPDIQRSLGPPDRPSPAPIRSDLKHHKLGVEIDPNRKPFPCHMILREPVLPAM